MHKSKNELDEAMQDYAQKWMKSLDKPRFSTNISNFFIAIFIIIWASTLTNQLGYKTFQGLGVIITLSIIAVLILTFLFTNHILTRIGFPNLIISSLWFSALIGPYISIVVINNSGNSALSHIIGSFSAVIAFILSYTINRILIHKSQRSYDP